MATATTRKRVSPQDVDQLIFERQAMICKAFSHPARLHILDVVGKGECASSELQERLNISKANLSQHIGILRSAGVISTRRDGSKLYCSLGIPEVKQACQLIRKVLYAQVEDTRKLGF